MQTPFWLLLLQAASYIFGAASAVAAALTYRHNSRQRRATWLFELYQRFYDSASHTQMRERIEAGNTKFAEEEADEALLRQLDDYLNFFEFVTFLVREKQLQRSEALAMFDYPLRHIANDNSLMRYLTKPEYGYEGLTQFLKNLSYP